ncbi:MAG: prepilin-type N-terminal cleavage/methylation domain-containing protein [Sulfurihydrogenibium sp.]|jgi:prepilin-type N-terminal cleavage/methylation domain-containing protein|nr:prepilin-type N-terminal cleavage/methylation domain-containing protein [Sulfurihydrogenibium sp.]
MKSKKQKGFTLIELLIVIVVINVLAGLAIPMYGKYKTQAIKTALMSDIRNCISEIAIARQTGEDENLYDVVNSCPKSKFTKQIILQSENPIRLQAISNELEFKCEYDENNGRITCDSVF